MSLSLAVHLKESVQVPDAVQEQANDRERDGIMQSPLPPSSSSLPSQLPTSDHPDTTPTPSTMNELLTSTTQSNIPEQRQQQQ